MTHTRHEIPVTLKDGTRITVTVLVDVNALAHTLGARALKAKGRRALAIYGAVDVRVSA